MRKSPLANPPNRLVHLHQSMKPPLSSRSPAFAVSPVLLSNSPSKASHDHCIRLFRQPRRPLQVASSRPCRVKVTIFAQTSSDQSRRQARRQSHPSKHNGSDEIPISEPYTTVSGASASTPDTVEANVYDGGSFSNNNNNNSNNNSNGGNRGGSNDPDRDDECSEPSDRGSDEVPPSLIENMNRNSTTNNSPSISTRLKPAIQAVSTAISGTATAASSFTSNTASILLKNVPAPVLVALISLFSTITGSRVKARRDAAAAERARLEATRKHRLEIERNLRETYEGYAAPLLKSSAKLADRLYLIVAGDWHGVENEDPHDGSYNMSSLYSAFLLGRFFAHVSILKRERSLLDYGFPTADRIFANILGRVQGVLCANDRLLFHLQNIEHFFKPGSGDKALKAGPLKMSPRAQSVLGELMLRRTWVSRPIRTIASAPTDGNDDAKTKGQSKDSAKVVAKASGNSTGEVIVTADRSDKVHEVGPKAVLTFLEFSRLYERDADMRQWYSPVVREFIALEAFARETPASQRRDDRVGARAYFLQSALMDLVEFFDPLPHPSSVPLYQRRRLQLGATSYREEQRSPHSLRLLYNELANFRDHRGFSGSVRERLGVPHCVEVFVTGRCSSGDPRTESVMRGNCPYSHRVLIALREMGIPHKVIPIALDSRPSWFYLLHPWEQTPVIYHEGNVVSESGNIVGYLLEKFPCAKKLASAEKHKLSVGTGAFLRFQDHFLNWMRGDKAAKELMVADLAKLEKTLRDVQGKNEEGPFFGGERFSREDTAIVPSLHNVEVAARRIKGWTMPEEFTAIRHYLESARGIDSFNDSGADEEEVVRMFRGLKSAKWEKADLRLADMPE